MLLLASAGSGRFTKPAACEYVSSELLQFFAIRFAGDLSHGQTMRIYGFVAVRDEVDGLRNYIFNCSRDHAQEITAVSLFINLLFGNFFVVCFHLITRYINWIMCRHRTVYEMKCQNVGLSIFIPNIA